MLKRLLRASLSGAAMLGFVLGAGCERAEPPTWSLSEASLKQTVQVQGQISSLLEEQSGTYAAPKLMGAEPAPDEKSRLEELRRLQHGQAVYMKRCVQCHGVDGDGNGPTAASMYPRPRDYRKGIFKFTSTEYGSRPTRDDLKQTLVRGVPGTSMPSFVRLPKEDITDVVDYIMILTLRGEYEGLLVGEAESEGELDPEYIADYDELVVNRWSNLRDKAVTPLSDMPDFNEETVKLGRAAFLSKGCSGCHGEDGRGHTAENFKRKDAWNFPTRAADLTSGFLRGGQEPIDIYRRILGGINGTPMPSFRARLQTEPDTIWHLVSYVQYIANRRREGEASPAGLLTPYGFDPTATADASGTNE